MGFIEKEGGGSSTRKPKLPRIRGESRAESDNTPLFSSQ